MVSFVGIVIEATVIGSAGVLQVGVPADPAPCWWGGGWRAGARHVTTLPAWRGRAHFNGRGVVGWGRMGCPVHGCGSTVICQSPRWQGHGVQLTGYYCQTFCARAKKTCARS